MLGNAVTLEQVKVLPRFPPPMEEYQEGPLTIP